MKQKKKKFNYPGILFAFLSLFFATSILFASIWKASAQNVIRGDQYRVVVDLQSSLEGDNQLDGQEETDYFLAYPGILPDHPLYPIKVLRDQIWLFLSSGSKVKAEKQLLFADKRISAALQLMEKGKPQSATETSLKAEYYLLSASETLSSLEKEESQGLKLKFLQAAMKHEQVLISLQTGIEGEGGEIDQALGINSQAKEILNQN